MNSLGAARIVLTAWLLGPFCGAVHATEPTAPPVSGAWDVEQFRTGLVAISRADDHRTALLIFCTLYGTRNIVYAYDGRGMRSQDIPISQVRVLATPTIDVLGISVPSTSPTFDNDGYIIRMQIPLPADFDPVKAAKRSIESGPGALPQNRWSVTLTEAGLDDAVRIAFKNCF